MDYSIIIIPIIAVLAIAGFYFLNKKKSKKENKPIEKNRVVGHKTAFLACGTLPNSNSGNGCRGMNALSLKNTVDWRNNYVNLLRVNNYNSIYLYLADEGDGPIVNPYKESFKNTDWGITLDPNTIAYWKILVSQWDSGAKPLAPIFWLFPDDSGNLTSKPTTILKKYITDMVTNFDDLAAGYVVALEANEYFGVKKHNELFMHLKTLTSKPIGVHMTPDKNTHAGYLSFPMSQGAYYYVQTNDPGRPIQPKTMSDRIAKLNAVYPGKIVAAEYHLDGFSNQAKAMGRAAVSAGAVGVGTGG